MQSPVLKLLHLLGRFKVAPRMPVARQGSEHVTDWTCRYAKANRGSL